VEVLPIDERDPHRRPAQLSHDLKASEAASDDDDTRSLLLDRRHPSNLARGSVYIGATGVYAVLMRPGLWELLILAFVIVLLFGATRLPAFGRYLGRGMREFKDGLTGKDEQDELPTEP